MDEFELFIKAVKRGSVESFDKYFKSDYLNRKDNQLWCPIHYASQMCYKEIIEKLISLNCDINECGGPRGMRPIQIACLGCRADIVTLLTQAECDIEWKDAKGKTITAFDRCQNTEFLDILEKRRFILACKKGDSEAVRSMLKAANIEYCDKDNRRPIHWASDMNHIDIVKLLLEQNCNIDEKDKSNFSPLDIARKNKNEELIKIFEEEILERSLKEMVSKMGVKCTDQCDHKQLCPKSIREKTFSLGVRISIGNFNIYKSQGAGNNKTFVLKEIPLKVQNAKYIEHDIFKFQNLLKHERIIQYFGAVKMNENQYIIMEYAVKGSLDIKLNNDQKGVTNNAVRYSKQILEGLKHLHDNNIIHRDLKPGNILLDNEDNVKLADFDVSRYLIGPGGETMTVNSICGSTYYMAPEMRDKPNEIYGYSIDIWAFGVTLIYMLSDKKCMERVYKSEISAVLVDRRLKEMKDTIETILKNDPDDRPTVDNLLQLDVFSK